MQSGYVQLYYRGRVGQTSEASLISIVLMYLVIRVTLSSLIVKNLSIVNYVTGCHTTGPTKVTKSPDRVLNSLEVGKHKKYDDHARAKNAVLVPIAFNEYGLFGKEAEDFFVILANEATREHPVPYIHMSLHEFRTQLGCKLAYLNYSVVHEWARRVRKASYCLG